MALLNEDETKIITDHPLNDLLAEYSAKFRGIKLEDEKKTGFKEPWRDDINKVLGILINTTPAFELQTSDGERIAYRLFMGVRKKLQELQPSRFRSLINAIVAESSDIVVWTAVIDLVEAIGPSTPKNSAASKQVPAKFATPLRASSAHLSDNENCAVVEERLFHEIRDSVHRNVPGFFQKHFDPATWDKRQKRMVKDLLTHHNGHKWPEFPGDPWEKPVWEWLTGLEKDAMAGAPYTLHTTRSANDFKDGKSQMDLMFRKPNAKNDSRDVVVVGEHNRTYKPSDFKGLILQLARYVRSIFSDQPLRRFVHAFTLCGDIMELWVFDRSGLYSSGEFNIHENPERLAHALVAYSSMNNNAMGLDTYIELRKGHRYVIAKDTVGNEKQVEVAKGKLLVRQRAIVCRGTTCYQTAGGVAKFSWRSADRQPSEVTHLILAAARGVKGVANMVAHCEITIIAELRSGLQFSDQTRHKFQSGPETGPYGGGDSVNSGSSRKRKAAADDRTGSAKRRSNSQRPTCRQRGGSTDGSGAGPSDPSGAEAGAGTGTGPGTGSGPSLYQLNRHVLYENRILSCLVISPAGRMVSDFNSVRELLEVLRDAIRAHQSLFTKGRILHRDISSNNIIITDAKQPFRGMLIDLDLAKDQDRERSGARHQTGTVQFMAIQVLCGVEHTYRQDLESFFYVLLWMCARESWSKEALCSGETPCTESLLRQWEIGTFKQMTAAKRLHMREDELDGILNEFPKALEVVKLLCVRIRSILFGDTGRLMINTPAGDPQRLYSVFLSAYEKALN